MKTRLHPNEDTDLNRWGDVTESIRGRVPGANIWLHKEFARGLELLLRRQVPPTELADTIDKILGNVMRAIECDGLSRPDLLPALVRSTARQLISMSVPRIETEVNDPPSALLESMLQHLPENQREGLEMIYVDGADNRTVCALTRLNMNELIAIKSSIRERFLLISRRQWSKTMGQ